MSLLSTKWVKVVPRVSHFLILAAIHRFRSENGCEKTFIFIQDHVFGEPTEGTYCIGMHRNVAATYDCKI